MNFKQWIHRTLAVAAFAGFAANLSLTHAQSPASPPLPGARMMTSDQARQMIAPFYEMLNRPATKDVAALAQ